MRRLPRLRSPAPAGLVPTSISSASLRAPAAAASTLTPGSSTSPKLTDTLRGSHSQTRRYLSTSPLCSAAQQQQHSHAAAAVAKAEPEEYPEEEEYYDYDETAPAEIQTRLVYPRDLNTVPPPSEVPDPTYKPADTAEGLEEVGGLADWWDDPAHWGSPEGGVAAFVQSVASPFGPAERVTDPAMLEVLARRAIVESLVVARFVGAEKPKVIDRLFRHAGATDRVGKIVRAEVVAGEDGAATLKEREDWQRVWDVLRSADKMARKQQQQGQQPALQQEADVEADPATAEAGEARPAKAAPRGTQLTPELAKGWIRSWNTDWKKAELRDPVVKFFAAKRIQQLTGHRIPDGKLLALNTVGSLLKQLIEPPKPKKLAELIETKGVFKDLPNVRVFPRRVTPIDKEKMVGRWKIIVKELEKRELPVIGKGHHSAAVERKWIDGRV